MIKRYDNHLIPSTRSTLPYPDVNCSMSKGSTFAVAMHISAIQSLCYYYYTTYSFECKTELFAPTDFTSLLKLSRPKIRRLRYITYINLSFDAFIPAMYFRTSDEAYIDMFLNYPSTIDKHPDVYQQLHTKYPEWFI